MIKSIIGVILIVLGLLSLLFFRNYRGEYISYPLIWNLGGILILLIGFWLIKKVVSRKDKEMEEEIVREKENFKQNVEKILVNFDNCKIKSNNYTEQIEKDKNYRVKTLDALYDSSKIIEYIEVNSAIIEYETKINGKNVKFYSPTINKDEITLRFYLAKQKETYIYFDKENINNYYFDTEFLLDK
jgi:hypothetical protein